MKTDLAPTLYETIDSSVVLWFGVSNQYVVIPKFSFYLLQIFLAADSSKQFIANLFEDESINQDEALEIEQRFSWLLQESNKIPPAQNNKVTLSNPIKPSSQNSVICNYSIGSQTISVNYNSKLIADYFHPQLEHLLDKKSNNSGIIFNIFYHDNYLYLYRKGELIYNCESKNYHLIQGAFAMELTNVIHAQTDDNWLASFHASTLSFADREAIMLVGASGNGKSTLSALLIANGLVLMADDFTPLNSENCHIYSFPNAISIKQGAFKTLQKDYGNIDELKIYSKNDNAIKYLSSGKEWNKSAKHLPCNKIILVEYNNQNGNFFNTCGCETILETLIPDSWISKEPEHAKKVLNWLKKAEFYKLQYSDNDFAIRSVKSLL